MLTLIVSVAALAAGSHGPTPQWLKDLLASPMAKKAASLQTNGKGQEASGLSKTGTTGAGLGSSGSGFSSANVGDDPSLLAPSEAANAMRRLVGGLLNEGKYDEAYKAVNDFRREWTHPFALGMTDDTAADCANMTGRYSEAYVLLLPWARSQGTGSPQYLLAISFASAKLGQVYPGQAEYCRDHVIAGVGSHALVRDGLDSQLASQKDAKAVAIMSCLALGFEFGSLPYLEMALRLDPQNTLAAGQLATIYHLRGRLAEERRIAEAMLKALPSDHSRRADFERYLAESQ